MIISELVTYRGREIPVAKLKPSSCIKVDVECPQCKQIRQVHYLSLVKAGHHVCQACKMKERSKQIEPGTKFEMLEVLSAGDRAGFSFCRCDCGTIKEISNRNLYAGQKSCGCIRAHNFDHVNRPKGEQHGMWKGGVSTERERLASTKVYKDWRRGIFERDGFVCAKCGASDSLNIHHIEDFDSSPDKRTDPNNGITLCDKCHFAFHRKYGRRNTNTNQLKAYLSLIL